MMQYDDLYQFEGDATIYISYSNDYVDYLVGGAFIWYTFLSPWDLYFMIYLTFIKKYFLFYFCKTLTYIDFPHTVYLV